MEIGVSIAQIWCALLFLKQSAIIHCKNSSVTSTPNLLYTHTYFHFGVPMEQIRCAGHTTVFTLYTLNDAELVQCM